MLVVMLPHKQLHLHPMVVDECDAVISRSSLGCEIGIAERKWFLWSFKWYHTFFELPGPFSMNT